MNERQQKIQSFISANGEAKLVELESLFPDISSMTLRRDLEKLELLGGIVRTRSGAKSIAYLSRLSEAQFSERENVNTAEKLSIAQIAYEYIKQESSIFLDTGTTVTGLSRLLSNDKLFIITTAPNIALECAKNPNNTVFMTGGQLSSGNLSLSGVNALSFLDNINIDVAFMGASGFNFSNGFTCGNYDECQMKKRVVEKAAQVIMLMDSSKFSKNLPFTFANLSDIDLLVTDKNIAN
ncbi:MAG: DeoR/GlpR family DNA-binding transcription regulator, partial [Oscillospiraceae bacterium]|nr:DeoR/GlpR family DNA-binding transcription regulator [Oscillospiraceae bacterium]